VTSITRPADLVTTYAYDALSRVTAIDHVHDGTPLLELGYVHDALGRLTSRTDDQGTTTFGYDDLDRLTSADYPEPLTTPMGTTRWATSPPSPVPRAPSPGPTTTRTASTAPGSCTTTRGPC
jgi:YD repeat-containing protein